jgi:hypothetical protein
MNQVDLALSHDSGVLVVIEGHLGIQSKRNYYVLGPGTVMVKYVIPPLFPKLFREQVDPQQPASKLHKPEETVGHTRLVGEAPLISLPWCSPTSRRYAS